MIGIAANYTVVFLGVRFAMEGNFTLGMITVFQGFLTGLHAANFDITHIFVDNLYKLAGTSDNDETAGFLAWCDTFGAANGLNFTLSVSGDPAVLPESITKYQ